MGSLRRSTSDAQIRNYDNDRRSNFWTQVEAKYDKDASYWDFMNYIGRERYILDLNSMRYTNDVAEHIKRTLEKTWQRH